MENQITTRAATKQVRMQHWLSVFRDRMESGLTVNEYCEQHSITKDSYYYWLREVRKAAIQSAGPVFAELNPPASIDREIRFQPEMEIQITASLWSFSLRDTGALQWLPVLPCPIIVIWNKIAQSVSNKNLD